MTDYYHNNLKMGKYFLLVFSFCFCLFKNLDAQIWFGDGDTYVYEWSKTGHSGYMELKVVGDTTINGQNYRVIDKYLKEVCEDANTGEIVICYDGSVGQYYVYKGGIFVYYLNESTGMPESIYTFSSFGGTDYGIAVGSNDEVIFMKFISEEEIDIQGKIFKSQYYQVLSTCIDNSVLTYIGEAQIVEGMGIVSFIEYNGSQSYGYLIPELMFSGLGPCAQGEEIWKPRCYFVNQVNYEFVDDCYELPMHVNPTLEEAYFQNFSVSPNPATDIVKLNYPANYELIGSELYSINGKKMFVNHNGQNQFMLSAIENGVYFVKFVFKDGVVNRKLVKQ